MVITIDQGNIPTILSERDGLFLAFVRIFVHFGCDGNFSFHSTLGTVVPVIPPQFPTCMRHNTNLSLYSRTSRLFSLKLIPFYLPFQPLAKQKEASSPKLYILKAGRSVHCTDSFATVNSRWLMSQWLDKNLFSRSTATRLPDEDAWIYCRVLFANAIHCNMLLEMSGE